MNLGANIKRTRASRLFLDSPSSLDFFSFSLFLGCILCLTSNSSFFIGMASKRKEDHEEKSMMKDVGEDKSEGKEVTMERLKGKEVTKKWSNRLKGKEVDHPKGKDTSEDKLECSFCLDKAPHSEAESPKSAAVKPLMTLPLSRTADRLCSLVLLPLGKHSSESIEECMAKRLWAFKSNYSSDSERSDHSSQSITLPV